MIYYVTADPMETQPMNIMDPFIDVGHPVSLRREGENSVAVYYGDFLAWEDRKIGYVSRNAAGEIARAIDKGHRFCSHVFFYSANHNCTIIAVQSVDADTIYSTYNVGIAGIKGA